MIAHVQYTMVVGLTSCNDDMTDMDVERIYHSHPDGGEGLLAIVFRCGTGAYASGIRFWTAPEHGFQVATMAHPAGYVVTPHSHLPTPRKLMGTPEVLYIRKGRVVATFYSTQREFAGRAWLAEGDILLLLAGGHGFEMLEDAELIEVKQGPYCGAENDKTRWG